MTRRKPIDDAPHQPMAVSSPATKTRLAQYPWLLAFVLVALTGAVYWQVRHFEFVNYDDNLNVRDNAHVQRGLTIDSVVWAFTTTEVDYWRPLTWLTHLLDWQIYGRNAGGHHLTNVILHLVNTLLLLVVMQRMTGDVWRSALVAGLFALHPLHVGSVAWVTERKDVLSGLFWMLTMLAYARYAERRSLERYLQVLLFFALGLMAKPMIVTLPFVLLLLDVWPLKRMERGDSRPAQLVLEKLPLLAMGIASVAITFANVQQAGQLAGEQEIPLPSRVANVLVSYARYVGKTVWPVSLSVYYPLPQQWPIPVVVAAGLFLAVVSVVVFRERHRRPYLLVGWLWYLGTLVPVIGLVQGRNHEAMGDRYMYLPLIGLSVMAAWSVSDRILEPHARKVTAAAVAAALLGVCAVASWFQVRYWKDSETLFRHALDVTRDNWMAHNNLGATLVSLGRVQEAKEHYEQSLRINPKNAEAHYNLGIVLGEAGRIPEAIEHLEQALRMNPDSAEAHYNLGVTLQQAGKIDDAIGHYEQALRVKPDYAEAHLNLGVALEKLGKPADAIRHYEEVLRLRPGYPEAYVDLGSALAAQGRLQEAITHFGEALQIKPDYAEAYYNRGVVLEQIGRRPEAIADYEQALRIKPDYARAHFHLGRALEEAGRLPEAIQHYQQALRIKPDLTQAQNALARLQAGQ